MTTAEVLGIVAPVLSIVLGAGGVLFAFLAGRTSRKSVRVSEEQLRLAREQAEMRPILEVECYVEPPEERGHAAPLVVEVANGGKAAASDVHGWIRMEAEKLGPYEPPPDPPPRTGTSFFENPVTYVSPPTSKRSWGSIFAEDQEPEDGFYEAQVYERGRLLPNVVRAFRIDADVRAEGKAKIAYRVVCAEGAESKATVEVEVSATPGHPGAEPHEGS